MTRFEPPRFLEEDFCGAGMVGHLAYEFISEGDSTVLVQRETVALRGLPRVLSVPFVWTLGPKLRERLESIRYVLEAGWTAQAPEFVDS